MGLVVALRAFFAALGSEDASERLAAALRGGSTPAIAAESIAPKPTDASNESAKTENSARANGGKRTNGENRSALTLLSALQREARFVDFIKEPLDGCDEATIGAAARDVRDRCAAVLERFFEIRPLIDAEEGSEVELDAATAKNPARVRISGLKTVKIGANGASFENESRDKAASVVGRVAHAGWVARKNAPPVWTGAPEDAAVLAPTQIDVE